MAIEKTLFFKRFLKGMLSMSLLLMLLSATLTTNRSILVQAAASNEQETLVGVIRWDGQSGGDPWNAYQREVQALTPYEWHWRLPFYATIASDGSVSFDGNKQDIMDQEIAFAKEAGIDYWAFCYYPSRTNSGLDYAYNLYQSSKYKNDINWAIIIPGSHRSYLNEALIDEFVSRFQQSNYQKVLDNRPLIYAYIVENETFAETFEALRIATKEAGLGDPYIVSMDGNNKGSIIGADAVSRYVTAGPGGSAYERLATRERVSWEIDMRHGNKVVPIVTAGWDARPRMAASVWGYHSGQTAWNQTPTVTEFANHLLSALQWTDSNPSVNEANAILIYSWNEFSEGGTICPLLVPGTTDGINRSMLDAVKSVTSGEFQGETNYIKNSTFCADGKPTSLISEWETSSPNDTQFAAKAHFRDVVGYSGAFHLIHKASTEYNVTTSQYVTRLDDGDYTIIAMVKSSGGQNRVKMHVSDYGGDEMVVEITATDEWTPAVVNINISSSEGNRGTCRIGFASDSPGDSWLRVGIVKMLEGNIEVDSPFTASVISD